jgi:hypothetical protein
MDSLGNDRQKFLGMLPWLSSKVSQSLAKCTFHGQMTDQVQQTVIPDGVLAP